jgi:glycosyltransferase involved in cell wall biosynthesis
MLTKLLMLGAAAETRGARAGVIEAYRAHGLFSTWPIEYVATHGAGVACALKESVKFTRRLAMQRRLVLHIHAAAGPGFWRAAAYAGAAIAARCPVILHLRGGAFDRFHEACGDARRLAMRALFSGAACVATPSQRLASWVRSVSPRAHALCVPDPVAIPPLAEGARLNLILFLGRLEAAQGIFDLLEAVSQLRAAVPDVHLVCAGDGNRIAVARYAERLGIAEAVKFTGWVGPSGKRALFESAAAYALPAYAEDMPMSLLEAMAAGVPAVASPVGGVPEVLADGVNGSLVAPGDVATLTRKLRKLLLDRPLAMRIGAAGRETVRLRFSPERALPHLERLYADLGLRALRPVSRPTTAAPA